MFSGFPTLPRGKVWSVEKTHFLGKFEMNPMIPIRFSRVGMSPVTSMGLESMYFPIEIAIPF